MFCKKFLLPTEKFLPNKTYIFKKELYWDNTFKMCWKNVKDWDSLRYFTNSLKRGWVKKCDEQIVELLPDQPYTGKIEHYLINREWCEVHNGRSI